MKRINKELANIRNKFKGKCVYNKPILFRVHVELWLQANNLIINSEFVEASNIHLFLSGDKQLDGYQKKKYVCKLLFIFLLGHDIDFGHMEAVNLLSSNKYTEKQIVSIPGARKCILIRFSLDCNNKYVCSANALKRK